MSEPLLLTVEQSDGKSHTHTLEDKQYVLGRGQDSDLCVPDQGISRRHARLSVEGPRVVIEDLESRNGVLVNGARIERPTPLREGDQIVIGMAFLTLHRQDAIRPWIDEAASVFKPIDAAETGLETTAFESKELVRATADVQRLWLLYNTGRTASGLDPLPSRMRLILDYLRMALGYERALILLQEEAGGYLAPCAVRSSSPNNAASIDRKLQTRALEGRSAVLTKVAEPGKPGNTRSALCVPLIASERSLGLIYLENEPKAAAYTNRDLDLLTAIAHQIALAVENDRLIRELKAARDQLAEENVNLKQEVRAQHDLEGLVARGSAMEAVKAQVRKVLARDSTLLILGESGTGKEVMAKTIHYNGPRASRPFVALNCAAIPENLLEAELFGIESGVATGVQKRIGKFEQAADGTLFLDEIGELSPAVQAKLLRVLEERQLERVGGSKPIAVEARIITATNRDLLTDAKAGRFREDLYYRLAVIPIVLPPLRRRKEDIPALAEHFLKLHSERPMRFSPEAMEALCAWDWPGNVRELSNEVERAVAMAEGPRIERSDLSEKFGGQPQTQARGGAPAARPSTPQLQPEDIPVGDLKEIIAREMERLEKKVIERALETTGNNKLRTAKLLGLSREGLRKKMLRYAMGAAD